MCHKTLLIIICISFLFIVGLTFQNIFAAENEQVKPKLRYPKSFTTNAEYGKILLTHDFVKGNNPLHTPYKNYMAYSMEFGIETDGRKLFQQLWGYPTWGFGFYKLYILNEGDLGSPFSFYTFFDAPIKRMGNWSINYKIGLGLSYKWTAHKVNEKYDYPIGSKMNVYFDMGLSANVDLSEHFGLKTEFVLTHFSNGSMRLPNYGLNLRAISLGLKYIPGKRPKLIHQIVAPYEKEWEGLILFSPAFKQVKFEYINELKQFSYIAFNYSIYNLTATVNRQISYRTKLGGGLDISFNEAYAADTIMVNGKPQKATFNLSDKLILGVFPSVEFVINHVSLVLQPGYYFYKKNVDKDDVPTTYQRIGVKYTFQNNIVLGVNVRAYNFYKADFIEWLIGYRIKWKKQQSK